MYRVPAVKAISAILILEILVFTGGVVPAHASADTPHDNCDICYLIQHPPTLHDLDPISIDLFLQEELVPLTPACAAVELTDESSPSRAPPSLV